MDETIFPDLSTTIANTLSSFREQYGHLLSDLSATPSHPWEYAKWETFGPDYVFPTIDTVNVPISATTGILLAEILQKNQTHSNLILSEVSKEDQITIEKIQTLINPYVSLSSDDTPFIPEQVSKQYISFLEMMKQIDVNSIIKINDPSVTKTVVDKILYASLQIGK